MDNLKKIDIKATTRAATPLLILVVISLVDIVSHYFVSHLKKKGTTNLEELEAMQEIKRLTKEANSLSTPSTFAQAAKLRRAAAAKEKELFEIRKKFSKGKYLLSKLQLAAPIILKGCIYFGLAWWFWGVPVAGVSVKLLQPFGNALSWRFNSSENGLVTIGIIPWLLLTTRFSAFVSRKLIPKRANTVKRRHTFSG